MCGTVVSTRPGAGTWKVGDMVLSIFKQTHLEGQITEKEMESGLRLPLPGVLCKYRVFPEYELSEDPGLFE
jgi:hypothetical protein